MGGLMGWFLTFVIVVAVFNAEKLPALREMFEEKFRNSVDAAKEGSKLAKDKLKQVKTDMENKKSAPVAPEEAEENTPEEIAAELQVMSKYVPSEEKKAADDTAKSASILDQYVPDTEENTPEETKSSADETEDEKPIDLEHRY